ncbi:hypothetical protein KC614_03405 [candidate division WWE3 bacterium]|uniref:Uncharacterized protein n=1 Tax=candidate division WWE3 bacterium TaxID=2053526 RepID=A0A955LK40_UNCKA|nr:hypothetical protein [candidate division WWE3 bacterium]
MNQLVLILTSMSLFVLFTWIVYYSNPLFVKRLIGENDPFERKVFHGNVPFWQLILLAIVFPVLCLFLVTLWFKVSELGEYHFVGMSQKSLLWWIVCMIAFAAYGTGTHAASVSIRHYMVNLQVTKAFRVTEFYHHLVSHFLIIMSIIGIGMLLALHQFNNPLVTPLTGVEAVLCMSGGMIAGSVLALLIIEGRGIFYSFPSLILGITIVMYWFMDEQLQVVSVPIADFVLAIYGGALLTMLYKRLKNGSLQETIGEFFHATDEV